MEKRVKEMEAEALKLREMQEEARKQDVDSGADEGQVPMETEDDRQAADERSVYVGNVSLHITLTVVLFLSSIIPRLTTVLRPKTFRLISNLAEPLTE